MIASIILFVLSVIVTLVSIVWFIVSTASTWSGSSGFDGPKEFLHWAVYTVFVGLTWYGFYTTL